MCRKIHWAIVATQCSIVMERHLEYFFQSATQRPNLNGPLKRYWLKLDPTRRTQNTVLFNQETTMAKELKGEISVDVDVVVVVSCRRQLTVVGQKDFILLSSNFGIWHNVQSGKWQLPPTTKRELAKTFENVTATTISWFRVAFDSFSQKWKTIWVSFIISKCFEIVQNKTQRNSFRIWHFCEF